MLRIEHVPCPQHMGSFTDKELRRRRWAVAIADR